MFGAGLLAGGGGGLSTSSSSSAESSAIGASLGDLGSGDISYGLKLDALTLGLMAAAVLFGIFLWKR